MQVIGYRLQVLPVANWVSGSRFLVLAHAVESSFWAGTFTRRVWWLKSNQVPIVRSSTEQFSAETRS